MKIAINNIIREVDISIKENEISKEFKLQELKQKLSETDYIACKIAEGSATAEEYAEMIVQRQIWRDEINKLEDK